MKKDQIDAAIAQLRGSERGRRVFQNLIRLFDEGGDALDMYNKQAVRTLLEAGFDGKWPAQADRSAST